MSSLQWWHRGTDPSAAGRDAAAEAPSRGPFSLHTTVLQPHRWVPSCTDTSQKEPASVESDQRWWEMWSISPACQPVLEQVGNNVQTAATVLLCMLVREQELWSWIKALCPPGPCIIDPVYIFFPRQARSSSSSTRSAPSMALAATSADVLAAATHVLLNPSNPFAVYSCQLVTQA